MKTTRRSALLGAASAALLAACETGAQPQHEGEISPSGLNWSELKWARGIENQRRADLGEGRYLNPILAGDHPDPTIIRDGDAWYMTFSSFESYPGLVIWKSSDLVNWTPVTAALKTNIGSVWAPELVKHQGRYFLYIPARFPESRSIYVIHAEKIEGPWSEPVDLKLPRHIDPGHAVGEDAKRYLFLSGGDRISLSDDGLSTVGEPSHVYDPWKYPDNWVVVLLDHGGRRNVRPAHRTHGDRGAVAVDQWAVGAVSAQSDRPDLVGAREMVVSRARDAGGGPRREVVHGLSRL
jgi:xylan 1,4-beta-xylosidase